MLEVAPNGSQEYRPCLQFDGSIDYPVHMFIGAGGKIPGRRRIDINRVMFYDNEPEIEGEAEEIERRSRLVDAMHENISPMLIHGDINAAIYYDEATAKAAYNDNLRAYNGKYAQLVGKFHANEEAIDKILHSMPDIQTID